MDSKSAISGVKCGVALCHHASVSAELSPGMLDGVVLPTGLTLLSPDPPMSVIVSGVA